MPATKDHPGILRNRRVRVPHQLWEVPSVPGGVLRVKVGLSITVAWVVIVVAITLWRRNVVGLALLGCCLRFSFRSASEPRGASFYGRA